NIVVDLGKLYYKPSSLDLETKNALLELINCIQNEKISYDASFALAELSADRNNGGVINEKYRHLEKGLKKVMDMNFNKLRKHAFYSTRAVKNSNIFIDFTDNPNMSKILNNTLKALNYSYVLLAKFFLLLDVHGEKNKEQIYIDLLEFAHAEIQSIPLYELAVIIFYIFSSDEEFKHAQNLMKVNKKLDIVKKIWNVSWDMTYLRYLNDVPGRFLSGEQLKCECKNNVLITKDVALANISDLLTCDSDSVLYDKFVPNAIIDASKIKEKFRNTYEEQHKKYHSDEMRIPRVEKLKSRNPLDHIKELNLLVDNLTKELLAIE
ncbi:hypothetical protein, partial [Anaerosolibacter sp.]|uniref:hypothetical protein n=1 Tax=Anaerosolibacter sp. TaxID=1872527 RepID=UPI0039F09B01